MEELQKYKQVFDEFDTSGDNKISKDELKAAMSKLGYNPTEQLMEMAMEELDKDNSGFLNFPEFMEFCQMQPPPDAGDAMRKAFQDLDTDGSGYIGKDELREIFKRTGNNVSENMLEKIAVKLGGEDGRISFEEFLSLMNNA
uniref:AmphiCaBP-like protein n=1 Tax=Branchiostoma belcheri tsingtauense TaxID=155462 RepID=Q4F6Z0_BRABE|nr:AmphiCaBP-like protein [Branchiostoma belcheri tsingtauense]